MNFNFPIKKPNFSMYCRKIRLFWTFHFKIILLFIIYYLLFITFEMTINVYKHVISQLNKQRPCNKYRAGYRVKGTHSFLVTY